MNQNRRHIVLIDKSFQFKLIAKFIIINILMMIICGLFLYIFLNSEVDSNLQTAHVTFKNIRDMLLPIIVTISIINILVSSIIIVFFVLYTSHKVAGPMYRFNEALRDILNKNLKTFTDLRDGDQLYECSITLKQVSKALTEDLSGIKAKISEVKNMCCRNVQNEEITKELENLENIINLYKL